MAGIWCLVSAVACRYFTPSWPGRIGLFAVLVGIPFWELPYGYYNFQQLCETETRPIVYESVPSQDSICLEDLFAEDFWVLRRLGFKRIEFYGKTNYRKGSENSPEVLRRKPGEGGSSYCYSSVQDVKLPWRARREDHLISRFEDKKVVARLSGVRWRGMWWQEQMSPIFGDGGGCYAPYEQIFSLLRNGSERSVNGR